MTIPTAAAVMLSIRSTIQNRKKTPATSGIAIEVKHDSIDRLKNNSSKARRWVPGNGNPGSAAEGAASPGTDGARGQAGA